MKDLRSLQPELCILDRDIVCVVLAALMHDLGHPTYSHMFETFMASIGHATWTHEQASIVLVKEVLKTINLSLITADEEGDDLEFICELIDPPKDELNKCLGMQNCNLNRAASDLGEGTSLFSELRKSTAVQWGWALKFGHQKGRPK